VFLNLPLGPLRSLVMIAETGSIKETTERVFLTQSAVSLQIKRLEDLIRAPVFSRKGRGMVLTAEGERLLTFAREILEVNDRAVAAMAGDAYVGPLRIGVVQDFAETLLSGLLARFVQLNPETVLDLRVGNSSEMREMVETDRLDIALCLGFENTPKCFHVAPMLWLGEAGLVEREALPLALLAEPCIYRAAAIDALEASNRRFRVVVETASVSALRAAVESGIAITCRAQLGSGIGSIESNDLNLPPLPSVSYSLFVRHPLPKGLARLCEMIQSIVQNLCETSSVVHDFP
jgi:DNA-binding transcriptional LysR family regulator